MGCTNNRKVKVFKRNQTNEYEEVQEITATAHILTCGISGDHQYISFTDGATVHFYKMNSNTSQFETWQNIVHANLVSIDFTSDAGYIVVVD